MRSAESNWRKFSRNSNSNPKLKEINRLPWFQAQQEDSMAPHKHKTLLKKLKSSSKISKIKIKRSKTSMELCNLSSRNSKRK
jgi:hypothetical protein